MAGMALITGASSGIGEELARVHAQKGGDMIIVARRKDRLQALAPTGSFTRASSAGNSK